MCRRSSLRSGLAALAVVAFAVSAGTGPVRACSISAGYVWPSVEERTRAADYVVAGRVKAASPASRRREDMSFWDIVLLSFRGQVAIVSVDEWLKGDGPDTITVTGFGWGGDCRSTVPEGRAIIFLAGNAAEGTLTINDVGVYDAVAEYDPEWADRVRAAAGG